MADPFEINYAFPRYQEVVDHHDLLRRAVNSHFDVPELAHPGATTRELETFRTSAHLRVERQSTTSLIACLEACFRVDYIHRKKRKLKDLLSKDLIKVFNRRKRKAALMDDIIKAWMKAGALSHADYSRIHKAFNFRHWVAHGQYWHLKKNDTTADYYEIATLVEGIMNASAFHLAPDPAA